MSRSKKFRVEVKEEAYQSFYVYAVDEQSAIDKITEQYEEGEISLYFDPDTNHDVVYRIRED